MKGPKTMAVCICKKVPKIKVLKAMEEGASTVAQVKKAVGAGNGACHGRRCTPKIKQMLEEFQATQPSSDQEATTSED